MQEIFVDRRPGLCVEIANKTFTMGYFDQLNLYLYLFTHTHTHTVVITSVRTMRNILDAQTRIHNLF